MKYYPAIDIYNQEGVRLIKGDFERKTVYGDPLSLQKRFASKGISHLHLVDLNGAKQFGDNKEVISQMLKSDMKIQVGGGIRSLEDAAYYLERGADTIVLGTLAIKNFELLKTLNTLYPGRIVVGLDARNGEIAIEGWMENASIESKDMITKLIENGINRVVYTDILKDGMLSGPNFQVYEELVKIKGLQVIASGGITSMDDIRRLESIGVYGVIIGKAIYEGKIKVGDLC